MTFVTRPTTTWGELRGDERIVDKAGNDWLTGKPEHVGTEVRVTIHNDTKSVVVVKPATDTVTVIREARSEEREATPATDPWAEAVKDDTDRAKAVIEETFGPTTEILPVIDTALELRSHLYLLHGVMIHEATTRAALLEHHRQSHKLEAAGKGETGYTPHEHKEEW